MAVIYSKLGGCLGVTAKLGPLARTDLCAGVKRFVGKVNDPLRVRVFWGRPLREPTRGGELWGCFPSYQHCLGGSAVSLGSPEGPLPD